MFAFKHKETGELLEVYFEQFSDDGFSGDPVTLTTSGATIFIGESLEVMERILNREDRGTWLISTMENPYLDHGLKIADYTVVELIVK